MQKKQHKLDGLYRISEIPVAYLTSQPLVLAACRLKEFPRD